MELVTNFMILSRLFAVDEVDWRAYAATKGLSEKQQKIADKVGAVCKDALVEAWSELHERTGWPE